MKPAATLIKIREQRFEQSPFAACYADPDMVFGVYAGRLYPSLNHEDTAGKYWTLRRKCVLFDVPERPVEISGPDAVAFLEHVLACHVGTLREGRGRYGLACTQGGGLFMDGILFRMSENRFWYVQPDGAFETWLMAHSGGFDVQIRDPQSRVLQIQGPTSAGVLSAATGGAIDAGFKYFHAGFFEIGAQRVYVSRTGWTGEMGYEIYTMGAQTDCPRLWADLLEAGAPFGLEFGTAQAMAVRRIEAGILDSGSDFDWSMSPAEAGLERFVAMDKASFIGKEALRRAPSARRLYGVKCPGMEPQGGMTAHVGEAQVGRLSCGAWSPYLGCGIGILRVDAPGNWPGRTLLLRAPDGDAHSCTVVDLPFYDPGKDIPRGIDTRIP